MFFDRGRRWVMSVMFLNRLWFLSKLVCGSRREKKKILFFFLIPGVQWGLNGSYIGRHCNKSVLGWDSKALSN